MATLCAVILAGPLAWKLGDYLHKLDEADTV
jgi:hypothetical protein